MKDKDNTSDGFKSLAICPRRIFIKDTDWLLVHSSSTLESDMASGDAMSAGIALLCNQLTFVQRRRFFSLKRMIIIKMFNIEN